VSHRNDLVPVSPDEGAVKLTVGSQSGGDAVATSERLSPASAAGEEIWLLAAVEASGTGATGVAQALTSDLTGARLEDPGAVLKQLFRKINTNLYQQGMGGSTASAVALVTRGKYATIAQAGDGQVFLMRAGRLNQVTRPAAAPTPVKGGKGKGTADAPEVSLNLLGTRERLDSRQPAIFELTLLPEDRVMVCSGSVANSLDEKSLIAQLAVGNIEQSLATVNSGAGAAAVALVAAARERQPVLVGEPARSSYVPILAAIAAVLIVIIAVLLYGYL
jgi:hypothetical protein